MGKSLMNLCETKEQCYADEVLSVLNTVAKKHIFFELLRLDWQERLANAKARNYVDIVDLLPRLGKYYLVDTGIRNLLLTSTTADLCHLIENVVYLELLRPGNKVSIGKLAEK